MRLLRIINRALVTGLYVGHLPGAPGTYGSFLTAMVLLLWPALDSTWSILLVFLVGSLLSTREGKITGIKDEQAIIIDEVAGMMLAVMALPHNWWISLLGFFLFRLLDILKPLYIDRVQQLPGGWGVMMDDVLAGVTTNIIIRLIMLV